MTTYAVRAPTQTQSVPRLLDILSTGKFPDQLDKDEWLYEIADGAWKQKGMCYPDSELSEESHLFFPTRETSLDADPGKELCVQCSVSLECLTYALFTNQQLGTWGGESPEVRRGLRRDLGLVGTAI